MKKYLPVLFSIFILLGLVIGSEAWVRALYESARNYQPPLNGAALPTEPLALPKTAKVVMVLLSGLGDEAFQALELPVMAQLAQTGVSGTIQSIPPTYSQTARMTLITGASPELNGAALIDQPYEAMPAPHTDSIFSRAHEAHLKTALLGLADWRGLVPREALDETFFVESSGPEADQTLLNVALPLLKEDRMDLVLIQFTGLDFAALQQGGAASDAYRAAAVRLDDYIGQISRIMNLDTSILVILSDHGHISSGGSGGAEIEVTQQPLVMNGFGLTSGQYSVIAQTDIAPTVATLLGLPAPHQAQGRILFEMLNLSLDHQTLAQIALTRQRLALAENYLAGVQGPAAHLPDSLGVDIEQAADTFAQNNIKGAFELALLTQKSADTQIAAARHNAIQAARWPRLFMAAVAALISFFILWRQRNTHAGLILIATVVTLALYHVLFQLQGHSYSISGFNLTMMPFDIARRMGVSFLAGGALVLLFLMLIDERNWLTLLGTGYGYCLLTIFILALPLFWAFGQNGFVIEGYLPSVELVFWQVTSLLEVLVAAIIGLILPWPIMALNVFVNFVRRHLSDNQSKSGHDPLPGLR
ncbi:MAG: alkaline phosphatase family protein [Anaerolineaceae bacterium]|nr:alkaline phosphatase family protein [Anaerolineaceae bacterium]MCB9101944.1 alkaline phosphatase family protein [Anaerolineales bacterium]